MTRILIVEGNDTEIINDNRDAGITLASEMYRTALMANDKGLECDVSIPFAPELQERPTDIDKYDGFALTGSGIYWCAGDPETKPYMDYLTKILDTRKPIIGSCWGMQTVVAAFGGQCASNPKGFEVGLAQDIELTNEGRAHPFFADMPGRFSSPCIHRDHVTKLPDCFELLASNSVSIVQAISCHNHEVDFFGFQFHPELDLDHLRASVIRRKIDLDAPDVIASFPENPDDFATDPEKRTSVFKHWLLHVAETKKAAKTAALAYS